MMKTHCNVILRVALRQLRAFLRPVKRKKFETFKHICLIKWPINNKTFDWSGMYRLQNGGTAGSLTDREYKHEILFILHFLQNGLSENVDFW